VGAVESIVAAARGYLVHVPLREVSAVKGLRGHFTRFWSGFDVSGAYKRSHPAQPTSRGLHQPVREDGVGELIVPNLDGQSAAEATKQRPLNHDPPPLQGL